MKAIRNGCYVKFITDKGKILEGTVVENEYLYGSHIFKIRLPNGRHYKTYGRYLYPNLLEHQRGKESRKETKQYKKNWRKQNNKKYRERRKRNHKTKHNQLRNYNLHREI